MMSSSSLTCREAMELITPDIDRRLSEADHNRLHSHLQYCAPCRSSWQEEQAVKSILKSGCKAHALPESLQHSFKMLLENPEAGTHQPSEHAECNEFRSTITRAVVASIAVLIMGLLVLQVFAD